MAKRINIFDDDISVDAAKSIIKSGAHGDDDEEDDEINWDGTPTVRYNKDREIPKPPMPDISNLATPSVSRPSYSTSPSFGTSPSYNSSYSMPKSVSMHSGYGNTSIKSHSRSHSLTIDQKPKLSGIEEPRLPFKELKEVDKNSSTSATSLNSNFSLASLDDGTDGSRKQMSASDIDKMQKEIQSLRRSLLSAKRDRWVKLPIEDTLRRIMKGESYSLEMYRSLADKQQLLDMAIRSHDGNAITAAILFMKNTVSNQIFCRELRNKPTAANHYLHYLKEHYDYTEYMDTLGLLGRTEEAAIFRFHLALPTSDIGTKISKIKDCQRSNFSANPALGHQSSLVQEYVDLLERQRPIEDSDAKQEASGQNRLFKDFPRKSSLIDMSVITTLYYCSLYHFNLTENSLGSPLALKKRHLISEKQYVWTSIGARAKLRQWKDIEAILTTKGWFGGTKLKAVIGFDKIVHVLHKYNAPPDVLDKYLALMDNPEQRLGLAMKVKCHKTVIDTYAALKDRGSLETYASKLDRYSKDGLYAYDVLNGSLIKWK